MGDPTVLQYYLNVATCCCTSISTIINALIVAFGIYILSETNADTSLFAWVVVAILFSTISIMASVFTCVCCWNDDVRTAIAKLFAIIQTVASVFFVGFGIAVYLTIDINAADETYPDLLLYFRIVLTYYTVIVAFVVLSVIIYVGSLLKGCC